MKFFRAALSEILGLFIDDGSLALFTALLIAIIGVAVEWLTLPPLIGAVLLFIGCLMILLASLLRATRRSSP